MKSCATSEVRSVGPRQEVTVWLDGQVSSDCRLTDADLVNTVESLRAQSDRILAGHDDTGAVAAVKGGRG